MTPRGSARIWPAGIPTACELCGQPSYGFTFHPLVRTCQACCKMTALQVLDECSRAGIDPVQRNPIEPDDADIPSRRD